MVKLQRDEVYRRAMSGADVAIPDSGLMVLLWRILRGQSLKRISGLIYLKQLLREPEFRENTHSFFVLPTPQAKEKLLTWAKRGNVASTDDDCYVAPFYGEVVEDRQLLERLNHRRPAHVVIAIGNGPQEKLGYFLRKNLSYQPAIHCIGAALGFLTGDQIGIPNWADRWYLGWLFRLVSQPRIFVPRLTRALALPWLMARYGENLPPLRGQTED
jgi:N-acetylglucosaminyldiphosphoundecaprenol N-acetyl-beta-D-mannosaminyltransferase